MFAKIVSEEGLRLLGWRDVPVKSDAIGPVARSTEPFMRQIFIGKNKKVADQPTFERKLYVIRKRAEHADRGIEAGGDIDDGDAVLAREDVALGELVQPLSQAKEAGADVIVTPCPLCHLSLDAWQGKASALSGEDFHIPILHLAQLLGAAAGLDESELKFKRHVTRLSTDVKHKLKVDSVVGTQA